MIIISDSSCDIWSLPDAPFKTVPLEISTDERTFIDDESMNVGELLDYLEKFKGRSFTACPSASKWLEAFGDEEEIYVVTMTSELSGTFNAAQCAKKTYLESHPDAKILIVDTLSTSAEQLLVVEKIRDMKNSGSSFEEIETQIEQYMKSTRLFFAFESLRNLAQNGRVPKLVAGAIGVLGITIIGTASEDGHVKPTGKSRGSKKVIASLIANMQSAGYTGGKITISQIENEPLAAAFSAKVRELFPQAQIEINPARGLVAYYGERHGLIIGCECN